MLKTQNMKKYISTACLFVLAMLPGLIFASLSSDSIPQREKKLGLPDMEEVFESLKDMKIDIPEFDSSMIMAFDSNSNDLVLDMQKRNGTKIFNFSFSEKTDDKTPTRIEKKTFTNISEIEFFHKYGDIIILEATSNQIDLEIQYFDSRVMKGSCNVSTTNKLLSISTNGTSSGNRGAKINYIISIPRNIGLDIDLKYGNIRLDKYQGPFTADLSYSNLNAKSLNSDKVQLKLRYSDVKIGEVQNVDITGSYSDVSITKAKKIEFWGNYSNYKIGEANEIITKSNQSSYGDLKVGTATNIDINLKYTNIVIDNLISNLTATTTYGDLTVKSVSPKLKAIKIKGSYADVAISLPSTLTVEFDAAFTYGDISISKKYPVKHIQSSEAIGRITKKGIIGSGTPTAKIEVSNAYADIVIR